MDPLRRNGNKTWVQSNTELDLEWSENAIGVCMGFKRVFTGFLIILSIVSDLGPGSHGYILNGPGHGKQAGMRLIADSPWGVELGSIHR